MAGLSGLRDEFGVDRSNDNHLGKFIHEVDPVTEKSNEEGNGVKDAVLRGLFDQVLYGFFKDLNVDSVTKPLPPLLYNNRPVDLFRLFCLVKERGGLNVVSGKKLWGNIAVGMDLDFKLSTVIELLYLKYLDQLDKWLIIISKDGNLMNSNCEYRGALQLLLYELKKRFTAPTVDGDKLVTVGDDQDMQIQGLGRENSSEGEDGKSADLGSFEGENESQRRKCKEIEEMLCWMIKIAKDPRGSSGAAGMELRSSVLLVREARLMKKYTSHQKKKQKIGPSLYNDDDDSAAHVEGTRSSSRIPTSKKTLKCSCCSASSTSKRKRVANHSKGTTRQGKQHLKNPYKRIPYQSNVGLEFQAQIPSWTGRASEDDSKWLGTRVWPPTNQKTVSLSNEDLVIGKGRYEVCKCPSPGSMACVRLHTAENNMKLRDELREVFNQWRFNQKRMRKSWKRG